VKRRLILEHLWYLWSFRTTRNGKMVFAALAVSALAGSITLASPMYHVFLALLGISMAASVAGVIFRPRCRLSGALPAKLVAGRPAAVRFEVENRSFLPAYDVALGLFGMSDSIRQVQRDRCVPRVGPGQSAVIPVELVARRRGVYQVSEVQCFSSFPFNLFRSGRRTRRRQAVTVLPSYHPVNLGSLIVPSRYQPGGIAFSSRVGESPEYIGSRPYRPGDSTRRIDFRSWARLSTPAVREFQEEYYCRVALVLDTFVSWTRVRTAGGFADLEAAVSLTASIADAMCGGEYIIDIFAAGPKLYVFRAGRHTAHFDSVLEILAAVRETRHSPFREVAPALADELGNISTVVCVLLDWDEERRRLVRLAVEAGCAVRTVVIRRRPPTLPVAADEAWAGPIPVLHPREVQKGGIHLP